jgi:hypothetical protein
MPPVQQAFRLHDEIHPSTETCPTCDQPIPNEKAKEIRARAAAMEKRLAAEAESRATQKLAADKAEIEAAAKARIEQAERDKDSAIKKASEEATAKVEAAKDQETEAQKRLEVANAEKAEALAKVKQVEAERDTIVEERVREVREAMAKHEAEALAAQSSANDEKLRKALGEADSLKRQLEQQRADALGEGAHIKLLDALKEEFPGDDIRRIRPGVSGADILHTVMRNGQECGSILWESKNAMAWQSDYVTKLIKDQTAASADHAVLSTFKFPTGTAQVTHRDGVVIVNPARAVAIAHMLRKHLLTVHIHRLSKAERVEKMAALYDYMTSERCSLHLNRIDSDADALLDLQVAERKFHDNHWGKQALRYKSIQKAKADLDIEVGAIIGGVESVG